MSADDRKVDFDFSQFPASRKCGHPTNAGTPCTVNAETFIPGCGFHADESEIWLGRLLLQAWRGGFRLGQQKDSLIWESEIAALKAEVKALRETTCDRVHVDPDLD